MQSGPLFARRRVPAGARLTAGSGPTVGGPSGAHGGLPGAPGGALEPGDEGGVGESGGSGPEIPRQIGVISAGVVQW